MKYLVDYLRDCNRELLLDTITNKHVECSFHEDINADECKEGYSMVLDKLLSFGEWTWFRDKYTVWFNVMDELFPEEGESPVYIDVCLRNKNYIIPTEGLKPWGGKCEDRYDSPEGHYNVNWVDYNQRASTSMPWRILVNLEVEFDESVNGYELEKLLSEFLWEVTFDGFDENSYQAMRKELTDLTDRLDSGEEKVYTFDEAMKEIDDFAEVRGNTYENSDNNNIIQFSERAVSDIKEIIADDIRHKGGEGNDCEID